MAIGVGLYVFIYCDGDGCNDFFENDYTEQDEESAKEFLISDARLIGWLIESDHHLCPACAEKR